MLYAGGDDGPCALLLGSLRRIDALREELVRSGVLVQSGCSIPCNLCGARDVQEIATRDRDHRPLRTVICRKCGLVWTDPRPSEDEVKTFYAHDYRVQYKGAYQPKLKHVYRGARVTVDRFKTLRDFLKPGDAILDVGSGGGEMVYLLRRLGYDACGLEPNEGYARYAREELRLPITIGFFKELGLGEKTFDVVTLYHVLEHLEDPLGTLVGLRKCLKPAGHLIIEVPNVEATCQAPNHRFHFAHLYNFNPATLATLAQKAGYEVLQTRVSADGGNVGVFLKKWSGNATGNGEITGNCERIIVIMQRHTTLAHYLSVYPYSRLLRRAAQAVQEWWATKRTKGRVALLEEVIYAERRAGLLPGGAI